MGFEVFNIVLENQVGLVYFPGQIVTGKIHIVNKKKARSFKGLFLECKGLAQVTFHVREKHKRKGGYHNAKYSEEENYFYHKTRLSEVEGSFKVDVGQFEYPFWFSLPGNVPSSYESNAGHVRYTMRAILERPWKSNFQFKMSFTVNTVADLNLNPQAALPQQVSHCKQVGIPCCARGVLEADIWVERKGYVPGESILFCAHVDNKSGKKMLGSKVRLVEFSKFSAEGKCHEFQRVLEEKVHSAFRETDDWDHEPIAIPPTAPSGLPFCNIIDLSYKIQFIISYQNGCKTQRFTIDMDVIIGNVPLHGSRPPVSNEMSPSAPVMPLPEVGSAPPYQDFAPPCYEQAMNGAKFEGDEDPENFNDGTPIDFNPRYATFKRSG